MLVEAVILIVGGGGAASALAGIRLRRDAERRRVVRRLQVVPPMRDDVAEGALVTVSGTVKVLDDELVAPLSGARCVMYRARLRSLGAVGATGSVDTSFAIRPFAIDAGSAGVTIVRGSDAEVDLPAVAQRRITSERSTSFKVLHGVGHMARVLLDEVIIEPGTWITVAGRAQRDLVAEPSTAELGFRDSPRGRLELIGSQAHPLLVHQPRAWHELPRWIRA
jgi:hypothetical protein